MATLDLASAETLHAPWVEWERRGVKGRRILEAGTYALTEGAIAAGCRVFAGYPITPATDIAEYMSKRLPQVGGYYVQCEDELAGMHACAGASLGGLKAMTATSGPGYTLMHDAYGWSVTNEIPLVVVDAMRVGPISGITGAPGQGEFYVARYCSHGGNFETIVLSPCSVQEAFWLTIDAFNLAERFRTPVTILTDQVVSDMWEDLFVPDDYEALDFVVPRRHNLMMPFYPVGSADIDVAPNVIGHGTGVCVSAYTHTEEGYDIEEMEAQWAQTYRLVNKIRHHRSECSRYETLGLQDADVVAVVTDLVDEAVGLRPLRLHLLDVVALLGVRVGRHAHAGAVADHVRRNVELGGADRIEGHHEVVLARPYEIERLVVVGNEKILPHIGDHLIRQDRNGRSKAFR